MLQGAAKTTEDSTFDLDSNNATDDKSREQLQGELSQKNDELSEKEFQLKCQGEELDLARIRIASFEKNSEEVTELKQLLVASQEDAKKLQQEFENERKEHANKLKEKDETVEFFMNELARLKMEQSSKGR